MSPTGYAERSGANEAFDGTPSPLPLYVTLMELLRDPSLLRVLAELGIDPAALLGYGSEACVFAYGREQVVRIHHAEASSVAIEARTALLDELHPHHGELPFAIPHVTELRVIAD